MNTAAKTRLAALAQHVAAGGTPVPSPCVALCTMDAASGHCQGCWRTLAEIAAWGQQDAAAQRRVWAQIALRNQAGTPRLSAPAPTPSPSP